MMPPKRFQLEEQPLMVPEEDKEVVETGSDFLARSNAEAVGVSVRQFIADIPSERVDEILTASMDYVYVATGGEVERRTDLALGSHRAKRIDIRAPGGGSVRSITIHVAPRCNVAVQMVSNRALEKWSAEWETIQRSLSVSKIPD